MSEISTSFSKLIDSLNGGAKEFGEFLKNTSPEAWRIAVYQSQIEGWRNICIWLLISLVGITIGMKFISVCRKLKAVGNKSDADGFYVGSWIIICVSIVIFGVSIGVNIDTILNPGYSAASDLLAKIKR